MESANVRVDKFVEKGGTLYSEEPKAYITLIYVNDDAPNTQSEQTNQVASSHQT